jgi:sulfate permease, SulP family
MMLSSQEMTLKTPLRFALPDFFSGRAQITADLTAGVTVGMVLVPQSMAYAALAGMPPEAGLYAASFACIVGALFGYCAQVNTGPVAMTSLLSFAALAPLATPGSADYLSLAAILAILVGVVRVLIGCLRGTFLVALISHPVLTGFTAAAGITIACTQLPKFFLLPEQSENPLCNVILMIGQIGESHLPSLGMGMGCLMIMIMFKKFLPRWPGLLIAMVVATIISWLVGYENPTIGGQVVGHLPQGLPAFSWPTHGWGAVPELLPGALLVAVIGLLEVMTVTSTVERSLGKSTDLNLEIVGQGVASMTAGVTGGFPVSGSLSRSSLNLLAGAKTGLSSVVSGLVVLLTLLILTPLLEPLPYPALAAAIVMAVSALIRPKEILIAWNLKKSDGIFAVLTLVSTLAAAPDMVVGMMIGIGAAVLWFIYNVMNPRCLVLSRDEDGRWSAAQNPSDPVEVERGGVVVYRVDARLNFLNSRVALNRIKGHVESRESYPACVFCTSSINDIDATGCEVLVEMKKLMDARGQRLILADVKAPLRAVFERHPVLSSLESAPSIDGALDLIRRDDQPAWSI